MSHHCPEKQLFQSERMLAYGEGQHVPAPVGATRKEQFENAPDVPGRRERICLRDGLDLAIFDMEATEDVVNRMEVLPCFSICLLRQGGGQGYLEVSGGRRGPVLPYNRDSLLLVNIDRTVVGVSELPAGQGMRGIELNISHTFLDKLGVSSLFKTIEADRVFNVVSGPGCWAASMPVAPRLIALVDTILNAEPDAPGYDLILDGSSIAILQTIIETVKSAKASRAQKLSSRDHHSLVEARKTMEAQLAHPWTVAELARCVGLNEKKLKSGFRHVFGLPVYSFLQTARLERARALLVSSEMSILETALEVGYANPSHFAALFKREFGETPSEFRQLARTRLVVDPFSQSVAD